MASLPPVANLQAFEAVARRRSFALAAAELHLSASAVSHQVARLESHLGVRLVCIQPPPGGEPDCGAWRRGGRAGPSA